MLIDFLMLYQMTGTFSIRDTIALISPLKEHVLFTPALLLFLFGAFTKSSQFPFHIWLPDAMQAPPPVRAYLHSVTMVIAGIYIVKCFMPIFVGDAVWFYSVSFFGFNTF